MNELSNNALIAKQDDSIRQRFIAESQDLILRLAYKACGTYVTTSDDNYSIALIAYNEAIDSYDESKGNFTSFAYLVIKRRLTDEYRRQKGELPVSPASFEGQTSKDELESLDNSVAIKMNDLSSEKHYEIDRQESLKEEILAASELISYYGFSFYDLADYSPKSKATKAACKDAVICILRPGDLYDKMKESKLLPIKEIEDKAGIKRKTLERHRKYIMAVAELLHGDFPHLSDYLSDIKKGLEL